MGERGGARILLEGDQCIENEGKEGGGGQEFHWGGLNVWTMKGRRDGQGGLGFFWKGAQCLENDSKEGWVRGGGARILLEGAQCIENEGKEGGGRNSSGGG